MQTLERDGFSKEQVILALHAPNRRIDFRYELLDRFGNKKKDLYNVVSGEVSHSAFATIKRTARFTLKEDYDIDYLNDRIKPYVRIFVHPGKVFNSYIPFYSQQFASLFEAVKDEKMSGWVEFALGEFLLSSPTRKHQTGRIIRNIEAYDGLTILNDDKFTDRYTVLAGTNYKKAVIDLLTSSGITKVNIEDTNKTLPTSVEFKPGKEKIFAINELLGAINFEPIHVDVNGYYVSSNYQSPSVRTAEYSYITDSSSVMYSGMEETLELFNVPNKFVVVRSNPEQEPLRAEYTNDNANSIISTVNRGRTIVDYREIEDIADQESLDAYVQRIAFEASQVYGKVVFETAIMPMHDYHDVLQLEFTDLGVKDKYSETSWTMQLKVGGKMKHEVRKVVAV